MAVLETMGLEAVDRFQQALFWPVLRSMHVGVRIDLERRREFSHELRDALAEREAFITEVVGHPINTDSPKQMQALFYHDLAQRVIKDRVSGKPTLDEEALGTIAFREPLLQPLVNAMLDERVIGKLKSTFVDMKLSEDGRARTSFNICGTTSYRLASRTDAFDSGGNLENIPSDKSKMNHKIERRGSTMRMPNVRRMYVPDPDHIFFDLDLKRADLQIDAWESGDAMLKQMLREGVDVHQENARTMFGPGATERQREIAKTGIHLTHKGGKERTLAVQMGITVREAVAFQKRWFEAHPAVLEWHHRLESQLAATNTVSNVFGYRRYFFERPGSVLGEAIAWIAQSTVARVINEIWLRLFNSLDWAHTGLGGVLLQVHDSLAGQFPSTIPSAVFDILALSAVSIPYPDPLVIPVSIKTSSESWGDCV